jgi:hypothetical protein
VAHICNPSYSGDRDQGHRSLKPAQANSSWDPISKNPSKKKKGLMAQGIRPGSNPITEKKKDIYSYLWQHKYNLYKHAQR